jgi:hypothetical protein
VVNTLHVWIGLKKIFLILYFLFGPLPWRVFEGLMNYPPPKKDELGVADFSKPIIDVIY